MWWLEIQDGHYCRICLTLESIGNMGKNSSTEDYEENVWQSSSLKPLDCLNQSYTVIIIGCFFNDYRRRKEIQYFLW